MAISSEQLNAIEIVKRVSSAFSLIGTLFIIITFLVSHEYRKPPNRLIFYAAWGNIMSCVTCTIALAGPRKGEDSDLCQAQAFFMQWLVNSLRFLIRTVSNHSIGLCGRMFSGDSVSRSTCGLRSSADTTLPDYRSWNGRTSHVAMDSPVYLR
jgi:hypothetical protein